MPNILLTDVCNRRCPYCFAREKVELGTSRTRWEMPRREFERILEYLDPRVEMVSLLGGEPTLHAEFLSYVETGIAHGFRLKIFTNGTTPFLKPVFRAEWAPYVSVVLNLNSPESYQPGEWRTIEENCAAGRERIALSFNLYRPDFDWKYLSRIILKFELHRRVRLGIAQPIRSAQNVYLEDNDLPEAYRRIAQMAESLATEGISLGFDCGFRMCGFTQDELGILMECGTELMFKCRPILDVGRGLKTWRCFPFSTQSDHHVLLTDHGDIGSVISEFNAQWESVQRSGNTPECASCEHMASGACHGGGLCRTVTRTAKGGPHAPLRT